MCSNEKANVVGYWGLFFFMVGFLIELVCSVDVIDFFVFEKQISMSCLLWAVVGACVIAEGCLMISMGCSKKQLTLLR